MKFLSVTKPGIIFGNIITVSGGFFLGSQGKIDFLLLLITLLGMSLIIASGCVCNNYIDRDIDALMKRTQNRPSVTGQISLPIALLYALVLAIIGFGLLYYYTNMLTLAVAAIGWFFYVVVYSLWLKRTSIYGTLVGAIAGAVPPVVGYCAVTNRLDSGALILLLILAFWQIPHFYAIAIYRLQDYAAANIPILPIRKGMLYTKISMVVYMVAFLFAAILPTILGYCGLIYLISASLLGLIWLGLGIRGFFVQDDLKWARKVFLFSIINITLLSFLMAVK